jgi:hypothetical protein
MARVMMRCTHNWKREIFTGVDIPYKQGLKGLGNKLVACPACHNPHYLRRLYFEGDPPHERATDVYALDVAYGFAGEVGVIISVMAMIEGYLPLLLMKLTGMSQPHASTTMGTFYNFSHRLDLLEMVSETASADTRKDFSIMIKRVRSANNLRVKYAHAKYSVAHERVHVTPFYGDARKKPKTDIMTIDDVSADLNAVKAAAEMLHAYLYRNERPQP